MSLIRTSMNLSLSLLSKLTQVTSSTQELQPKNKTHDYTQSIFGSDYVFESLNEEQKGYMTGLGKGIKPNDYIILRQGHKSYKYQIEEIDYYSDPSDMWIALLKRVL